MLILQNAKQTYHTRAVPCPVIFRNRHNYNSDLAINNSRLTGINTESVFSKLKYFHVVDNFIVDLRHDCAEGICHYVMLVILREFIFEDKLFLELFTLELLNQRIKSHYINYV